MLSNIHRFLSIFQTARVSVRIPKKIIVLESDDWGSIRIPNIEIIDQFKVFGLDLSVNPYLCYDALEDVEDISQLLKVLTSVENRIDKKPKITLNYVMSNPDFAKIRNADFKEYFYTPFTDTYLKEKGNLEALVEVQNGIDLGFFLPQFHGREHVQATHWLELLQKKDPIYRKAFDMGFWGIGRDAYSNVTRNIQATFDFEGDNELPFLRQSIYDGLSLFKQIFGFPSKSFIPNNYIWADELNPDLRKCGIEFMQGMKYQKLPKRSEQIKRFMKIRRSGNLNESGILELVRNTHMEFSLSHDREKVLQNCLRDIKTAFLFKQPAVISIHRINFMGGIDRSNREQNLDLLRRFFEEVNKKWPEAEFMNTVELGQYIKAINQNEVHK